MTTNIQRISDAEYPAALAAGRTEGKIEIRAQAVRYVPERDAIEIVTSHNVSFFDRDQALTSIIDPPTLGFSSLISTRASCANLSSRISQFTRRPSPS